MMSVLFILHSDWTLLLIDKTSIMNKKIILAFAVGFLLIILGSIGIWLGLRLRETTPDNGDFTELTHICFQFP